MFFYKKILLVWLFSGVMNSAFTAQLNDSIRWRDIDCLKRDKIWLNSENMAGLHSLPIQNISYIDLYLDKENGELTNYNQSDNSFEAGLNMKSYNRLSDKTVFYGEIGYNYFLGKAMTGSVFINPEETPFDIVEYTLENRGTKKLEHYHLTGAVATDLAENVTIGGQFDYTTANYSKQKDLRHINKLLDLNLSVGAIYKINNRIDMGVNYSYRRRVESLLLDLYGLTSIRYYSLISYGGFFGEVEEYGDSYCYTSENEEKPLFDAYHGGSLQVNLHLRENIDFFNEFSYKSRNGYYGSESQRSVVYSDHNAKILSYHGILSIQNNSRIHNVDVKYYQEALNNIENIFRVDNLGGGLTDIVYYGTTDRTDRIVRRASIEYVGSYKVTDYNPVWVVKGGIDYYNRVTTASDYPFYRAQDIRMFALSFGGEHNITRGNNLYTISLNTTYSTGDGGVKNDGTYTTPSASQKATESMDSYLYEEYEYLTSNQIRGGLSFKYSHPLFQNKINGFVSINYSMTKAFNVSYIGDKRHKMIFSLGCMF